ncbi:MAG: hypothetical protein HFH93_00170 [Lachnospiraceae bacterium]|nr:hypothetical protein [Lachnospiraceae bacterium]
MADRTAARRKRRRKNISYYAVIVSILAVLIAAAFFAPQILFQIQDAILCKDTVLTRQESINVEALGTTYESLAVRMQNYAEGQSAGNTFYVTSQEVAVTSEMEDYAYSNGIYGEMTGNMIELGLLPTYTWSVGYVITDWKQYVIYSNDFTKGVNFILWYIEMQDDNEVIFKFLVDAEDGTVYAVKTEGNRIPERNAAESPHNYIDNFSWRDLSATAVWIFFASMYEAIDSGETKTLDIMIGEYGWTADELANNADYAVDHGIIEDDIYNKEREALLYEMFSMHEEWRDVSEKVRYYVWENDTIYFLLPFGDTKLDMVIHIDDSEEASEYIYGIPDILMGIRQIYEMIPEFA